MFSGGAFLYILYEEMQKVGWRSDNFVAEVVALLKLKNMSRIKNKKNKKSQTRICRYYTTNNTVLRSIKNSIFLFLFPLFIPSAVAWLYGIAYWYTKRQGVGLCANICKLTVNNERSKDCNLKNKCHKITLIDLSCQIITTNIPFPSYMQHWCMGLMAKKLCINIPFHFAGCAFWYMLKLQNIRQSRYALLITAKTNR